jgi:hypothetical protein
MSVIRADLVGPSLGGTTRSLVRGTAAAWVNFNGTGTIAARDSENVSSLTDNGTGDISSNFTNSFAAFDYVAMSGQGDSPAGGDFWSTISILVSSSAAAYRVRYYTDNKTSVVDPDYGMSLVHGDLA